ncbi:MAG: hypothetical protein JNM10_06035 [Planctomycetia bacterium]|nr:hypothetical protein [Planctomycetia bacterium]
MLHLGFDEAGYGPLLGPLVVGMSGFRVADDAADGPGVDLRTRLAGLVTHAVGRRVKGDPAVAIDDSKRVHGRDGVEGLARGVRAAAVAAGLAAPEDLADLLARFGDRPPEAFAGDPWCAGPEAARLAPWAPPPGWREAWRLRGVEPVGLRVAPVTPAELNEAFDAVGNKGRVLFLATAALLVAALDAWPADDVEAVLDREGGRLDYAADLASVFPFHEIAREPAPAGESRYAFRAGGRRVRLRFVTKGDQASLATGLASMAAKLTRELFMARFNAWFLARAPGVRPTAGYVEDGRRFLADVAPVIEREGIDRRRLVRSR